MENKRPYWYVDAKWVTGIICFFILSALLLSFSFWRLTSRSVAVPLMGKTIAYMYSRNGLDNEGEILKMKEKIENAPDGRLKPIPTMNIYVTSSDLSGKTPREIRIWFFEQVADPIWGQKDTQKAMKEYGVLALFSQNTNKTLSYTLIIFFVLLIIFGFLFIKFSTEMGRLFGPGLLFVITSFFNALFWAFALLISDKFKINSIPFMENGGGELANQFSGAFRFVAPDIIKVFLATYLFAFGLGILLIISSGIGKIIRKRVKKQE